MTLRASATKEWHFANLDSPVDGVPIRFGALRPSGKKAKRAIIILNGRSEWIEKYSQLPSGIPMHEDTIWVSLDHRGQGGSGGPKAYVDSYDDYAADISAAIEATAEDLPYSFVCHSMGGLIGLYGTIRGILNPEAMVLASPLFSLPKQSILHSVLRNLTGLITQTKFRYQPSGAGGKTKGFHGNHLTSSIDGFKMVQESPYLYVTPTFGWINATMIACEAIFDPKNLRDFKVPTRIIGGSDERVVDSSAWSRFCLAAKAHSIAEVDFHIIPGARHEVLNEINRLKKKASQLISEWIMQKMR